MGVRVLIVDDSTFFRQFMEKALTEAGIEVAGTAVNGEEAVEKVRILRPDLVTMDLSMPQMGGLDATQVIMAYSPVPIIVISAWVDSDHNENAVRALAAGALEIVEKPARKGGPDLDAFVRELTVKIKILARIKVIRHIRGKLDVPVPTRNGDVPYRIVAVGSSTGGPQALARLFGGLPREFPAGIVLVQHITPGFTEGFVQWLSSSTPLTVRLAARGEKVTPGTILVAPERCHLVIDGGRIKLDPAQRGFAHQPAADVLFESVAESYRSQAVGVLLTGMGSDGARGLKNIRKAGGRTIAQDEATCVVFGMPKVAIQMGAADQVLPIDTISKALLSIV